MAAAITSAMGSEKKVASAPKKRGSSNSPAIKTVLRNNEQNKEFHERITRIVQVIGKNELSLYSYLDNVLEQHFATYQEEISELYKKRNSDIF